MRSAALLVVGVVLVVTHVLALGPVSWPDAYTLDLTVRSWKIHPDYDEPVRVYSNVDIPAQRSNYTLRRVDNLIQVDQQQIQTLMRYDGGEVCYSWGVAVDPATVTDFGFMVFSGAYEISWNTLTDYATVNGHPCVVYTGHGLSGPSLVYPTVTIKYSVLASDIRVPVQWNWTIDDAADYPYAEYINYEMTVGTPNSYLLDGFDNCHFYGPSFSATMDKNVLDLPVINQQIVDEINGNPSSSWKAKLYPRFSSMTLREAMALHKQFGSSLGLRSKRVQVRDDLPSAYDHTEAYPDCPHMIRNQGACGSCFMHGVTEALEDRLCQASNQIWTGKMSIQYSLGCDYLDWGCSGGSVSTPWEAISSNGAVQYDCIEYTSDNGVSPTSCPTECDDGSDLKFVDFSLGDIVHPETEGEIMTEIYENGPVSAMYVVMQDFMTYSSGIYTYSTGNLTGSHIVKIVGWGEEGGVLYWRVANSWGDNWGEDGYFRIRRGTNEVDIENSVFAAEVLTWPSGSSMTQLSLLGLVASLILLFL
ncbi:cathepsin B [Pelomyxa schiedti]|nr:cathepsin B [Pelomyxa schiedti]